MTGKAGAKKTSGRSYDSKTSEVCAVCSGTVVYRKSSYFGHKIYYKVCNNCGWYETMDRDTWVEKVFATAEKGDIPSGNSALAKSEVAETSAHQEPSTQVQTEKPEQQPTTEKPKRRRGRPPKSSKKKEDSDKS
ncbi:MAG TPA: hypothetical protein ENF20_01240 [Candidatus Marinimicrobia bacterium]|nr:hypothetical protein [Candidatus Neomarinimicrobiota bacterium]